jgi:FkbM family methyltransferase
MPNFPKQRIKKLLHTLGIEAHRYHSSVSPLARLMTAIHAFDIDLILDVGANEGQFAIELREGGYQGRIVSFEPLAQAFEKLSTLSRHDHAWSVHPRCALGDRMGEIDINISANSVSSSILPMLASHSAAAPQSAYIGRERVPLITVDSIAQDYLARSRAPLLKIDTQGYEWQVLDGAMASLPKVRGIQMELSLLPLYEGQRLWRECVERLESAGFVLWSLEPAFVDPINGRTMQWNGLFFRQ